MNFKDYKIRKAKVQDSERVWEIRNHLLCRKKFNNSKSIPFEKHNLWFENKYFKNNDLCFILENNDAEIVGYCRFDLDSKNNNYIISIAVNPKHHTKGLGNYLLSESLKKFNKNKEVVAEVHKNNIASIKLFKKNHFNIYKSGIKKYYFKYKFEIED